MPKRFSEMVDVAFALLWIVFACLAHGTERTACGAISMVFFLAASLTITDRRIAGLHEQVEALQRAQAEETAVWEKFSSDLDVILAKKAERERA